MSLSYVSFLSPLDARNCGGHRKVRSKSDQEEGRASRCRGILRVRAPSDAGQASWSRQKSPDSTRHWAV